MLWVSEKSKKIHEKHAHWATVEFNSHIKWCSIEWNRRTKWCHGRTDQISATARQLNCLTGDSRRRWAHSSIHYDRCCLNCLCRMIGSNFASRWHTSTRRRSLGNSLYRGFLCQTYLFWEEARRKIVIKGIILVWNCWFRNYRSSNELFPDWMASMSHWIAPVATHQLIYSRCYLCRRCNIIKILLKMIFRSFFWVFAFFSWGTF